MTPLNPATNLAARMGRWSAEHRKLAIFGWLAFVAAAFVLGGAVGTKELTDADSTAGESSRAERIIEQAGFPPSADEVVFVQSRTHTASSAAFRVAVTDAARAVSRLDGVRNVRTPYTPGNEALISRDGRSAVVAYEVSRRGAAIEQLREAVARVQASHPGLVVEPFGDLTAEAALEETLEEDFQRAELFSIPITLGILIVAFGALVAAGIPLLLGLSAVMAALGVLAIPSQAFPVDDAASSVILLIGLAVGVDYSLFYLKREREERAAGRNQRAAIEAAAATSGRAIVISGLTVIIALAGMFLTGNGVFVSIAIGTILVVAIAVAGSLTVLPALLSWLGDRVERGRVPCLRGRNGRNGESRLWGAVLERVLRRPVVSLALAGGTLVVMAAPTLGLRTVLPEYAGMPRDLPEVRTYERIQAAFPGGPEPAVVAVEADDVTALPVRRAIAELRKRALASGRMQEPIQVEVNPDRTVALVSVPLAGEGTDAESYRALETLREDVVPVTLGGLEGVEAAVTGETATSKDFDDLLRERTPLVFAFVLFLAFGLLLVAFRSIVIAAKAIALNLLSVGAAYGILVAVFQWGWGESLLDFESTGGIVSWLPLFLFVILFGLSMDYHVFILSRIREAYDRGLATEDAVAHGIRTTAGVVTSAAVVMVAVFAVFATLSTVEMKQVGVGLATAILIDATVVRGVLLPAAMKLLGDWNWYLPRWLEWLPRVGREDEAPEAAPALTTGT